MKRFLPTLAVLTSCATAPLPAAPAQTVLAAPLAQPALAMERPSRRDMVRQILPYNVRFMVYEGSAARRTASGVAIGNDTGPEGVFTYVLTNAHAVDPEGLEHPTYAVLVENRGEVAEYPATPVAVGSVPELDLALVKVRGITLPAAPLAEDSELELGDDVVVAAAPYGRALSLSGGMVSQLEWDQQSRRPRMLKTDAPIGYGASGGGIYSLSSGKLLAIVEGYRTAKVGFAVADQPFSFDVPMPGETFAAPSAKVRGFLEKNGFARLLQRRGGHGGGRHGERGAALACAAGAGSGGRVTQPPAATGGTANMARSSWDQYFMDIARQVASRATCDRKHVGALLVRDRTILSTGYNGSIRGLPHCDEAGHMMENGHCVATVHAEANAIIQAAKNGVGIDGATIYTTASPCWPCFKLIANSGCAADRLRRVLPGSAHLRVRGQAAASSWCRWRLGRPGRAGPGCPIWTAVANSPGVNALGFQARVAYDCPFH